MRGKKGQNDSVGVGRHIHHGSLDSDASVPRIGNS